MGTVNIEDKLYYERTTVQYQKTDYEHKKKKEAFLEKVEEVEKKTQRLNFVPIQIPSPFCSSVSYPIPFKYISLLLNLIRVSF